MIREIVKIDEEKCDGCGICVPNCHEGAIQVIDGKLRLISDLMCDGLGACLGHCPQGALSIEKREAEPYDEKKVMAEMVSKGKNVVLAHLKHLKDHGESGFLEEGLEYLQEHEKELTFDINKIKEEIMEKVDMKPMAHQHAGGGCPGSKMMNFDQPKDQDTREMSEAGDQPSALRQWPVQMHLVSPNAPYFRQADVVIAADCVAFCMGNFHQKYLKGKGLAIACPKLDDGKDIYIEKIRMMIDEAEVNTITVMIMEVPCCGGLLQMVQQAAEQASRKVPVKLMQVGIKGEVLLEQWI